MKITVFQHHVADGPGTIAEWAFERKIELSILSPQSGLPTIKSLGDGLIVLGGPMGVYETVEHPWMLKEVEFVREAVSGNGKVLGICLGAQILASALGAKVYPHSEQEIGWFPVKKTEDANRHSLFSECSSTINSFHWHGDTFDLPTGAHRIFESPVCVNQAFIYKQSAIGFQFHPEADAHWVQTIHKALGTGLKPKPFVQSRSAILGETEKARYWRKPFFHILDEFFSET